MTSLGDRMALGDSSRGIVESIEGGATTWRFLTVTS
jgi:hypothetical protein